ncbi:MAG: hypothetical protein IJP66_06490 [Kiritimatiellae bacterium]|nr:hypothetical protein [Kiritimatiellia bacterium]
MAVEINGYNSTFKAFADFAQQRVNEGNAKAVAVSQSLTDAARKFSRTSDECAAIIWP